MKYIDHIFRLVGVVLICGAVTIILCMIFAVHAHGQETNAPVAAKLTPESVTQTLTAWNAVALLIGGVIWHMILKVAPWAKANGGLLRGVIRFFWDSEPVVQQPKLILTGTEQKPPPA